MSSAREVLTIQMAASGLINVEMLSKSDPFLEISRATEGGQWQPVFRTEVSERGQSNSPTIGSPGGLCLMPDHWKPWWTVSD